MLNGHPYLIHFPIAILSIGMLWDLLGIVLKKESFSNAGWWAQLFGTVAIIFAAISGLLASNTVPHSDAAHEVMETHETIGLIVGSVFILLFIWRSFLRTKLPSNKFHLIVYMIVGWLAVITMFYGAHLGGRLVYEFGVGGTAVQQPTHHHPEGGEKHDQENDHDSTDESGHQH